MACGRPPAALPTYRLDVIDEEAEQVGLLGRISENGNNNWYAVRLKVEPGSRFRRSKSLINRSISGRRRAVRVARRRARTPSRIR